MPDDEEYEGMPCCGEEPCNCYCTDEEREAAETEEEITEVSSPVDETAGRPPCSLLRY